MLYVNFKFSSAKLSDGLLVQMCIAWSRREEGVEGAWASVTVQFFLLLYASYYLYLQNGLSGILLQCGAHNVPNLQYILVDGI